MHLFQASLSQTSHIAPVIPVQHTMQRALFVKALAKTQRRNSRFNSHTVTLWLASPHRGSIIAWHPQRPEHSTLWLSSPRHLYSALLTFSPRHTNPAAGKRDVTEPGGREVENKAEPKLICHSLAGVLTIIGCHHFLIRPVSKKCSNKTAPQRDPPLTVHTHTGVLATYVHTGARRTNTSNMSESADPKNKTSLVSRWNGCFPLQGHPS